MIFDLSSNFKSKLSHRRQQRQANRQKGSAAYSPEFVLKMCQKGLPYKLTETRQFSHPGHLILRRRMIKIESWRWESKKNKIDGMRRARKREGRTSTSNRKSRGLRKEKSGRRNGGKER